VLAFLVRRWNAAASKLFELCILILEAIPARIPVPPQAESPHPQANSSIPQEQIAENSVTGLSDEKEGAEGTSPEHPVMESSQAIRAKDEIIPGAAVVIKREKDDEDVKLEERRHVDEEKEHPLEDAAGPLKSADS
jgi:hypothetical protein